MYECRGIPGAIYPVAAKDYPNMNKPVGVRDGKLFTAPDNIISGQMKMIAAGQDPQISSHVDEDGNTVIDLKIPYQETDKALSQSDRPADAKAVGDRMRTAEDVSTAIRADLTVQTSRINSIMNLPAGSTSRDAEVIDIRTGYDGTTYSSAGNAVRAQISDLHSDLDAIAGAGESSYDVAWPSMAQSSPYVDGWRSGYWSDTGYTANSEQYMRSARLRNNFGGLIGGATRYRLEAPDGYHVAIYEWTGDATFIGKHGDRTTGSNVVDVIATADHLYSFVVGRWEAGNVGESLTHEWIRSNLRLTVWNVSHYAQRTGDTEHFTVDVNTSWINQDSTADSNQMGTSNKSVRAVLVLPESYRVHGNPTKLIVYGHGSSGYVSDSGWQMDSGDGATLINSWKNAGYAVLDVDNLAGNTSGAADWGCKAIVQAYREAIDYVRDAYNIGDLYAFGCSMGTAAICNLIRDGLPIRAAAFGGPRPVVKARYDRFVQDEDPAAAYMLSVYGGAWGPEQMSFNVAEKCYTIGDRLTNPISMPPMHVIIGQNDTLLIDKVQDWITGTINAGSLVEARTIQSYSHHQACYLTSSGLRDEIIEFFNQH